MKVEQGKCGREVWWIALGDRMGIGNMPGETYP